VEHIRGHWDENAKKLFFALIFVKSGLIYVKPRPKWSPVYSTHTVDCISPVEMLYFCDICL